MPRFRRHSNASGRKPGHRYREPRFQAGGAERVVGRGHHLLAQLARAGCTSPPSRSAYSRSGSSAGRWPTHVRASARGRRAARTLARRRHAPGLMHHSDQGSQKPQSPDKPGVTRTGACPARDSPCRSTARPGFAEACDQPAEIARGSATTDPALSAPDECSVLNAALASRISVR